MAMMATVEEAHFIGVSSEVNVDLGQAQNLSTGEQVIPSSAQGQQSDGPDLGGR